VITEKANRRGAFCNSKARLEDCRKIHQYPSRQVPAVFVDELEHKSQIHSKEASSGINRRPGQTVRADEDPRGTHQVVVGFHSGWH